MNKTLFEKELQSLKPWDEVQCTEETDKGYAYICTAGHGYLVIPMDDPRIDFAKEVCEYGFIGRLAVYLEEDYEAGEFLLNK
jgi:hypothetical protein